MKAIPIQVLCLTMLMASCDPKNAGPVGNIFFTKHYWELEGVLIRENAQDLKLYADRRFLTFPTNLETYDERFDFWDKDKHNSFSWDVNTIDTGVNKSRSIGTYIKKTKSGKFFKATVFVHGIAYRLELCNLMDGSYQAKNDTVRYIYKPTEEF